MLGQLKDRFLSLQEEISASVVKQLAPSDNEFARQEPKKRDLEAGSDLLETWQCQWEALHIANERNAKTADRCDRLISAIKKRSKQQKDDVNTLENHLPKVNQGIKEVMVKLGQLESLLGDVEISLLALEDTIDAREMQEQQLDQRFQLAMYQERRKAEFNELANKLQAEHEKKRDFYQSKMKKHYQQQFDQDMKKYRESSSSLQVPARHDPDASLESVDLDDPEDLKLEKFLNDDVYDVSPLPKDETPVLKVDADDISDNQVPINIIPDSPTTAATSRAESMYFTPDATTDKLSEISLN